jgi:hypothetical protein
MTHRTSVKHQFVEFIPEELAEDILYISIRFATASHLCCCGCRNKVVTPLHPTDWKLTFDGKTVSLSPSHRELEFPVPVSLLHRKQPHQMGLTMVRRENQRREGLRSSGERSVLQQPQ